MFPDAPEISFADWLIFALPAGVLMFIFAWAFLFLVYGKGSKDDPLEKAVLRKQYSDLGKSGFEEKTILIVFISLAILWISRADILIGSFRIPGWENLFPYPSFLNDGTVAIAMAGILFTIPSKKDKGKIKSHAEEEYYSGKVIKRLVFKNFSRSKLDCMRYRRFCIRYILKVNKVAR